MKILIVDDSVRMRKLIISLLIDDKNEFYECEDGCYALPEYKRIKPDIVLMDVVMREMNGLDAAAEIINHFPEAKIITVTDYDDPLFRQKAEQIGIRNYIIKDNLTLISEIISSYRLPVG